MYIHGGDLPGTTAVLVRHADGVSWAALFNQDTDQKGVPGGHIVDAVTRAIDLVAEWPTHDLFPIYS
jgi:hypothetical protein